MTKIGAYVKTRREYYLLILGRKKKSLYVVIGICITTFPIYQLKVNFQDIIIYIREMLIGALMTLVKDIKKEII